MSHPSVPVVRLPGTDWVYNNNRNFFGKTDTSEKKSFAAKERTLCVSGSARFAKRQLSRCRWGGGRLGGDIYDDVAAELGEIIRADHRIWITGKKVVQLRFVLENVIYPRSFLHRPLHLGNKQTQR